MRRLAANWREAIAARADVRPMPGSVLMASLAGVLPDHVAVVEEAVTTTNTILERLGALRNTNGYFAHRGWALGWGLGCALGVKLAWPDRPVLAIVGEGAAMYGIQGLWSAARYKLAGDLRHLQQRPVPDSQGRRRRLWSTARGRRAI